MSSVLPRSPARPLRDQLERQVLHWTLALARLNLNELAAPEAWRRLERYLGVSLRSHLSQVVERLQQQSDLLKAALAVSESLPALLQVQRQLLEFRQQYLRAETTLDFFADAINTRTSTELAARLRACDTLAQRSMALVLDQIRQPTPVVLTYIDKGLGASVLKAGMRLWDGGDVNPCAAIKIVRHNLARPTSLIHEAGHQVAHLAGWNQELAASLDWTGRRVWQRRPGLVQLGV